MRINEVEQAVGITKKNIRFYEQEGLLTPSRNLSNGYRDYSQADIDTLRQIKLLRKLDVPLEEIRRIQIGSLTLDDCLERHLIVLARKAKNLEDAQGFCRHLLSENIATLQKLPAEKLLLEMEEMEKGGTKFMAVQQMDRKKRKRGALIGAFSFIFLMVLPLGILGWGINADPDFPVILAVLLLPMPILAIAGVLFVLRERFKEIEGGELDEASKY